MRGLRLVSVCVTRAAQRARPKKAPAFEGPNKRPKAQSVNTKNDAALKPGFLDSGVSMVVCSPPTEREKAFTMKWVRESGLFDELLQHTRHRKSLIADLIADGYLVASLVHWDRPDVLPSLHSFEPGQNEALRNWKLLRERVLSRLGPAALAACHEQAIEVLLRGRDAQQRAHVADTLLVHVRRGLRMAAKCTTVKRRERRQRNDDIDARYEALRLQLQQHGRSQTLDKLEQQSRLFDARVQQLRQQNLLDLRDTERRLDLLRIGVHIEADDVPPPPPSGPPPAHCVPVVRPAFITAYRRFDPDSQSHYYEDAITGATLWDIPASGIIHAVDDLGPTASGAPFYIDARTLQTAWTLSTLLSFRSTAVESRENTMQDTTHATTLLPPHDTVDEPFRDCAFSGSSRLRARYGYAVGSSCVR